VHAVCDTDHQTVKMWHAAAAFCANACGWYGALCLAVTCY
jgi:hypothetical protein